MTREEFAHKLEWEGWEYMLTEISPSRIKDPILAEALQDAQEAFRALLHVAPTIDDFSDEAPTFEELDGYQFDEDEEVLDLVDELNFDE